jgi:putative flippase GtrA
LACLEGKLSKTLRQLVNYFWVAGIGFVVDFGTLYVSTEYLKLPYLISAMLGFVLGLICNFFLSERFVFENALIKSSYLRFALFGLIGLIGLGILEFLMWAQVEFLKVQYLVAKLLATAIVYAWNFVARKWMYRK